MTTELEAQKAAYFDHAQAHRDMVDGFDGGGPLWRYVPPKDDDPLTWEGIAEFEYHHWAYLWLLEAEAELALYGKPFYCKACGHKRAPGRRARLCFDHAFDSFGYDEVLRRSRSLDPRRRSKAVAA